MAIKKPPEQVWSEYVDWLADGMNADGFRSRSDWVSASVMRLDDRERMLFGMRLLSRELAAYAAQAEADRRGRRLRPLPADRIGRTA